MEIAKACKVIEIKYSKGGCCISWVFQFQEVAGYKGDLGYETFLHGSQAEIRNVFAILIQKLPKVNEQPIADSIMGKPQYSKITHLFGLTD